MNSKNQNHTAGYRPTTLPQLFRQTAERKRDQVALRHKTMGLWQEISWCEYYRQARTAAKALLELGLQKGDFVAIIGENCPEWVILDMGIVMAGGVTVGIYTTSAWEQVQYVINHAGCRFLFAENEEQVDKWLHFHADRPQLEKVIYWEDKGLWELEESKLMRYEDFMSLGATAGQPVAKQLDRIDEALSPDDLAILVYTSGTTGQPKGAMLSHRNLSWMGRTLGAVDPDYMLRENEEVMSFLPLCHIFERLFSVYVAVSYGYTVNFVESPDTVRQNLREISPTVGYAVPRVWEKFYSSIVLNMGDAPLLKRLVFRAALAIGHRQASFSLEQKRSPWWLRLLFFIAHNSVFYYLKKRLGLERMRYAFSGAAPISPDVLRFFNAIGLHLIEGYGQTESAGVITASSVGRFRLGKVGLPLPGSQLRLSGDGEILFRSPGVFLGYYRNPEATERTLAGDWLHTGDIGELDEEGYLRILDRKKDLIITAGGKNIAPQLIENKLKFSPYINDAIVIGDRRKFITAIIVLDEDNINKYAQDHKISYSTYADLAEQEDIRRLIQQEVDVVNKQLARVENVRKFTILPKRLYEEDGEVTPTMKVKRKYINETYSDLIEAMYT